MPDEQTISPTPTRRAMIDPLRLCRANCCHCYYRFEDMTSIKPLAIVKQEIDAAVARGNVSCDISGGEPMLHPDIVEITRYCRERGLPARIITLGLAGHDLTSRVIDAGIDTWLISMHGQEAAHNAITGLPGARKAQERFIGQVSTQTGFDVNTVIVQANQSGLRDFAQYLLTLHPNFVNLIHFNCHRAWATRPESRAMVPNLDIVERELNTAIPLLEATNIGITIRYYPLCRISSAFRHHVCNQSHVLFDPHEWDMYSTASKTELSRNDIMKEYRATARQMSLGTEERGTPCCDCGLHEICGGMHAAGHRVGKELYGEQLHAESAPSDCNPHDFYFYRQRDLRTLNRQLFQMPQRRA